MLPPAHRWNGYDEAWADYQQRGRIGNDTLYDLCRRHPDHTDPAAVYGKVWLIERAYATRLEYHVKLRKTGPIRGALRQITDYINHHADEVDVIVRALSGVREPLNPEKLATIIKAHGDFIQVLSRALRKKMGARSFASKYLHFHCPAVPIYDSRAVAMLQSPDFYPWRRKYAVIPMPRGADQHYWRFVCRFWQLYAEARRQQASVSVRQLDNYLLWHAGGN